MSFEVCNISSGIKNCVAFYVNFPIPATMDTLKHLAEREYKSMLDYYFNFAHQVSNPLFILITATDNPRHEPTVYPRLLYQRLKPSLILILIKIF